MSRTTARSSLSDLAAAARGLSSARTPSQFTPFIVLSKWESRIVVHAASNVSTPCGTCAESSAEASAAAATARSHGRSPHLMSALIWAGGANTDGSTVSNSIAVSVMVCCTPIADCFNVVGTSKPPYFL